MYFIFQDLEILFRRTEALVSTAAEITFMTGNTCISLNNVTVGVEQLYAIRDRFLDPKCFSSQLEQISHNFANNANGFGPSVDVKQMYEHDISHL